MKLGQFWSAFFLHMKGVAIMQPNTRVLITPVSDGDNPFLQNIEIRLAGYYRHAAEQLVEQPGGDGTLLLYCTEGKGFVEIDGRVMLVNQGEGCYFDARSCSGLWRGCGSSMVDHLGQFSWKNDGFS